MYLPLPVFWRTRGQSQFPLLVVIYEQNKEEILKYRRERYRTIQDEKERKYLHLRMLINDIQLNCYKINSLTAEAVRIKDKLEQIEIVNNDT
jgi:hypothetical protein